MKLTEEHIVLIEKQQALIKAKKIKRDEKEEKWKTYLYTFLLPFSAPDNIDDQVMFFMLNYPV